MLNPVRILGDRLLAALMPRSEAGACVDVNGKPCTLNGRFNCQGQCIIS